MSDRSETPGRAQSLGAEDRRPRRLLRAFVTADSYGLVVLLIVVTYGLSVGLTAAWASSIVLAVQILTVWLALRTARAPRRVSLVADVLLGLAAVVAVLNLLPNQDLQRLGILAAASALLYLIAPVAILRDVAFRRSDVGQEVVLGAIAAYLLIGMFFAFAYLLVGQVQSGPFFGAQGEGTMPQTLFFSFITLTTTGYGNLVPAANPGQSMAVLEAVLGQLFLVTAVAKIISAWQPKRWRAPETPEG